MQKNSVLPEQSSDIYTLAEELSREIVAPNAEKSDVYALWPEYEIRTILNSGLGKLVIPSQYQGLGQGLSSMVRICEIFGYENPSVAISLGMHYCASAVIAAKATPHHIDNYITPICNGTHLTTLALSEPGTGVHFYFPETQLHEISNEEFTVNGKKSFVTNGSHADSYVISTQNVAPNNPDDLMSMFLLDSNQEGMEWGSDWKGFGMRGNASQNLDLNNVKIDKNKLLGNEGDQIWFIFNIVAPYFLTAMTGTYLGAATHAFDIAQKHVSSRNFSHTGQSLAQDSITQHKLAKLWVELQKTKQYVYWATSEFDNKGPNALAAILCSKSTVGETATHIANEAMSICGGSAYRDGSLLQRILRDIRACHVMSPTTDMLYKWAGRTLLDQPLLSD